MGRHVERGFPPVRNKLGPGQADVEDGPIDTGVNAPAIGARVPREHGYPEDSLLR